MYEPPIYIFEDNEKDPLPLLIQESFPSCIVKRCLKFADGNRNIQGYLKAALNRSKTQNVIVYLDMPPDNMAVFQEYKTLLNIIKLYKAENRAWIAPIVCLEYYFIKAFHGSFIELDFDAVERCIQREVHYNDPILENASSKHKKNFEKFCKFVKDAAFRECVGKHISDPSVTDVRSKFLTESCPCEHPLNCNYMSLKKRLKSVIFIRSLPILPNGLFIAGEQLPFDAKRVSQEVTELREAYNKQLRLYKASTISYAKRRKYSDKEL